MKAHRSLEAFVVAWLGMACRPAAEVRSLGALEVSTTRPDVPSRPPSQTAPDMTPRAPAARLYPNSPLGTNLADVRDYSTELPFADVFKTSRSWISGSDNAFDDGRPLAVDEHGWIRSLAPGQVARALMLWGVPSYRPGRWVVRYEGSGELTYQDRERRLVPVERGPGREVIELSSPTGSAGLTLVLRQTDPANPIRNLRVFMPGGACTDDPGQWCDPSTPCATGACRPFESSPEVVPWNPDFLARTAPFRVLRFMGWMDVTEAPLARFSDRPKPTDARFTTKGVPFEIMVDLANRLKADPWFTLPHLADDDYVRNAASLVRERLDPGLRVYLEYSNEVWNDHFTQARYARDEGLARGYGGTQRDPTLARNRFYAEESRRIFTHWSQVFGDPKRLVRVLAAQAGRPRIARQVLESEGIAGAADALAIAPYFGWDMTADERARLHELSLDDLFKILSERAIPEARAAMREHAALAKAHGLSLIAYEGGQHLVVYGDLRSDTHLAQLLDDANRDARMGALYTEYLNAWRAEGGSLFVHFTDCGSYSKFGRWGALTSLLSPRTAAPKYDALLRFIESNDRWW